MNRLIKTLVTSSVIIATQTALADSCIQPKIKDAEYVGCLTDGLSGVVKSTATSEVGGYVDKNGKIVIPFIYTPEMVGEGGSFSEMNPFSEGLAAVRKTINATQDNPMGQPIYGFIDKTGKTVIPFSYTSARSFSEGLAVVGLSNGKFGYINKNNQIVIPAQYDSANDFSNGLALVQNLNEKTQNQESAFIDKTGKVRLTSKYSDVRSFSDGLALVGNQNKFGYIDTTGKLVIPMKFNIIDSDNEYAEDHSFKNGKAVIFDKSGKAFCINKSGDRISCK